ISARKEEELEAAVRDLPGNAECFVANAADAAAARSCLERARDRFGRLDILVNNAATNPYMGSLMGIDDGRARKTTDVNQWAPLAWAQIATELGLGEGGGSILNVASIGGLSVEPGIGWYNVTKAALIHLTRHMAAELGPAVRVNALAPGLVKTDFARALWEHGEESIARRLPMRRLGVPDDVANAALFLVSDAASWITGHTLVVDGGATVAAGGGVSP
ncbi:MAG TPA: SDR family oxidoreductase, partial [Acidimicrobiales bacterium]|nr:SDR family oxidoreductase [Acidimicrobiales bacterium]